MTRFPTKAAVAVLLTLTATALAADAPKPVVMEPADVPVPKMVNGKMDAHFQQKHDEFIKRGKAGKIGVLFLGDSITEGWGKAKDVYEKEYGPFDPADFGINGDKTQHVLWRIDNGEFDGITPKVVVLMIGTNNAAANSAADIAKADVKIVNQLHQKLPDTKVLLLGIFPRGADPEDPKVVALRDKIKQVNVELAKLDDGKMTRYLDIGEKFLDANGMIRYSVMNDALHPTHKGYEVEADAIRPLLTEMMK